jgi:fatty-acid desaturase
LTSSSQTDSSAPKIASLKGGSHNQDGYAPHRHEAPAWVTITAFAVFHAFSIWALFEFSWTRLAVCAALYYMTISWGIGMGYHRLLTHRGYRVPKWLEYWLTLWGTMALEGGPIAWVGTHRVHHQFSDKHGDPHTPRDGAWWAHIGWMLFGEATHSDVDKMSKYAPDLAKDPVHRWLTKWHWVPLATLGVILLAFGGWEMVLWGIFLRVTLGLHSTWLVNSATHMFGDRRWETRDMSRNTWWVALLTFGEGWHNNHHAHPASARHGLTWKEVDISWLSIKLLEKVGLATKVHEASVESEFTIAKAA